MIEIGKTYKLNRKRIKFYIDDPFYCWDRDVYYSKLTYVKILDRNDERLDLETRLKCKLYHIEYDHNGYYFPEDCFISNRKNKLKRIILC